MTLNERIKQLENQIIALEAKLKDLSANTEGKFNKPTTIVGGSRGQAITSPVDFKTGMGGILGNAVIFNDSELQIPPGDEEPDEPTKGYNKHSHSRFSGGALIKGTIEIVEYKSGKIDNPHCQRFYDLTDEDIEPVINSYGETVKKIGQLDLVFNPDTETWGTPAYEIDVKKCNFVERDDDGNIIHSAPLYNEASSKTSIVWDESGSCWRLYAVYAEGN